MKGPQWGPAPNAQSRGIAEIVRIMPGPGQVWISLGSQVVGVYTHWNGRRTLPCTGEDGECFFDHRYTSRRWQGWLPVCKPNDRRIRYLNLTPTAVRDCPALRPGEPTLRGKQLCLSRSNAGPESRMYCVDLGRLDDTRPLASAPDVVAWLKGLWGPPSTWTGIRSEALQAALAAQQDMWEKVFAEGATA